MEIGGIYKEGDLVSRALAGTLATMLWKSNDKGDPALPPSSHLHIFWDKPRVMLGTGRRGTLNQIQCWYNTEV